VLAGWRPEPAQIIPALGVTVLATAAYCGLALCIASLLKPETTTAAATLIYVVMLAAGGIMFAAPGGAFLLPLTAHAEALRDALTNGRDISGSAWLVLTAWAVAGIAAAARTFKWE
jgi:ABC-2 type transport system permease protein